MKNLTIYFTLLIIILQSCDEKKTLQEEGTENSKTKIESKSKVPSDKKEKTLFEKLNCNPPKIENLKIKDSLHTGYSIKVDPNNDDIDSIHISQNKFRYESNLKIELVTYFCSSQYKDGYTDVCTNDKIVSDTIRSYIKIGDKKMFVDQFFEKIFNKSYFYFNHFMDIYQLKKLQFSKDKYYIAFFPCYYFGAQSWFDYLPVLFEIRNDKLSNTYIMPFTIFDNDPFQFMDFDNNGNPEWMGVDDNDLKIYPVQNKKMTSVSKFKAQLTVLDQGYDLKDTTQNWPCELKGK